MIVVLAFDVAGRTGLAVGRAGETPRATSVDLGKGRSEGARLSRLLRLVRDSIARFRPDLVVYEQPVGSRGGFGSPFLIGAVAVVVAQAHDMDRETLSVSAPSVRKMFLGRHYTAKDFPDLPRAKAKLEIKRLVIARCHELGWAVPDADAADACACWSFACATRAGTSFPPPGGLFHA